MIKFSSSVKVSLINDNYPNKNNNHIERKKYVLIYRHDGNDHKIDREL